jgi:ABC-type maltose transport system permease subunit
MTTVAKSVEPEITWQWRLLGFMTVEASATNRYHFATCQKYLLGFLLLDMFASVSFALLFLSAFMVAEHF